MDSTSCPKESRHLGEMQGGRTESFVDLLDFSSFLTLQLPKDARGYDRASCAGVPMDSDSCVGFGRSRISGFPDFWIFFGGGGYS